MKTDEVPQEKNATLNGARKLMYAQDDSGHYTPVASDGWKAEEIVTTQAVEEFKRLEKEALEKAQNGHISILAYYMYKNRMDITLLSQVTGFFKWTIKRDFKVSTFNKLSEKRLQRYASALGISISDLKHIPASSPSEGRK